jgi:hypothetical protein
MRDLTTTRMLFMCLLLWAERRNVKPPYFIAPLTMRQLMLVRVEPMMRVFTMTEADCDRVAAFIRSRVIDGGYVDKIAGLVSGDNLRAFTDLNIELAEIDGKLVGYLSWQVTYSTWRGLKGLYINDHYASARNLQILGGLLNHTIARGLAIGTRYIRTEVDITDEHITDTYTKAGFWHAIMRAQYYLEPQAFSKYVEETNIVPLV